MMPDYKLGFWVRVFCTAPSMQLVLRACAEWLYASPDIGHMLLECRDLIGALNGVRSVVEDRLLAGETSAKEADL
jgi:hypothetical protein